MVTWDDFNKIWASASPLTPYQFSDLYYLQGWNFIGSTPPARQMWDSIQKKNDEKFKYLRDNFGTPHIVTQASDMTDTDMVYVYMGSEAGWNSGHWYYYDEGTSSWADGGVYNSVAFVTDTTLSIAGQPADAKAVGDALALKADLAGCIFTGNVSVNADFSVTGDSTMTGNVSAGADVVAVGDVSSANIIASNNANIGGNATVTGSVASASLTTTADGTIGGNLSVSGTTTLTGDAVASADLSVAGDSALTKLSVSGTTALAGTSTAPTPSADDNSTKIATTEYVQTEIKPIETDVTINDKRISNIEKLLQGNLYDYQTDSTSAYTKSVPSGAMPYAGLEKVGGKTVVMNQLVQNGDFADTSGWSALNSFGTLSVTDGVLSYTYTTVHNSGNNNSVKRSCPSVVGHKYYVSMSIKPAHSGEFAMYFYNPNNDRVSLGNCVANVWNDVSAIATKTVGNATEITILAHNPVTQGYSVGDIDYVKNVMIIDLTLMFGAGNEPSTVEEFEAMFPASYYSYNEGELLSAGVTEVESKDSNNATLQTISIPAEVQALEGYGWSCPDHYNYIDYEAKKYVQEVGSRAYVSGDESDSTVITDGTNTYYPLTTAVETDISAYITDDNLINVEANGTLTFPNSNGDDYRLPVPSEETYMIDLQEAINNG